MLEAHTNGLVPYRPLALHHSLCEDLGEAIDDVSPCVETRRARFRRVVRGSRAGDVRLFV